MGKEETKTRKRRRRKGRRLLALAAAVLLALTGAFFYMRKQKAGSAAAQLAAVQTAVAERRDITSELTASSSLSPKDTYEVTSLVEGEILEADFEEGDVVEKGQVLYRIDASSMDSDLSTAQTSLVRAQESLATAREDYNEAVSTLAGNTYRSTAAGYVQTLYVKEGDKISGGTKLADLYDDSVMKLVVPFLTAEAEQIVPGMTAALTLEDTGEQLEGTVTNVSSLEISLSGGRLVKNVTIETANPGGLTVNTQATAQIGEFICGAEGTFEAKTESVLSAELTGNQALEVESLLIAEGSLIENGTGIFTATEQSVQKYIKNFQDSLNAAGDSVENAANKLGNTQDSIENYTITAPISGTIVTKNSKAGDKISRNSGSSTTMAVIYDLSAMTLEMSVDELDVGGVKVGQSVEVTADAIEGETFMGIVTNVSLQGSYSNGVTNYPVTVMLEETGELRPGMNVDARIILDSSEKALCIPAGALLRGDRVYVRDVAGNAARQETEPKAEGRETRPETEPKGGNGQNEEAEEGTRPESGQSGEAERASGGGEGNGPESDDRKGRSSNAPEGFHVVSVKTGIINDDYVEILSGLSEGDEVYVDPNAGSTTNSWQMMGPGGMGGGPGGMGGPGGSGGNRGGSGGGPGGRP